MTVISYYSIAIRFVLGDAYHSLSKEERRNLLHVIRKRIIVILFSKIKTCTIYRKALVLLLFLLLLKLFLITLTIDFQ